jgi:hypothetical protein
MVDAFTRRRVDGLILNTSLTIRATFRRAGAGNAAGLRRSPPIGLLADAVITDNYEQPSQRLGI